MQFGPKAAQYQITFCEIILIVRNVVTCTGVRRDVRIDGQMDITGAHLPTNCLCDFSFKFYKSELN